MHPTVAHAVMTKHFGLTPAVCAGTGNITGQDLTAWLQGDAERVPEQLVAADWLRLPGTVAEAPASRPEGPTAVTVPLLLPEQPRMVRPSRAPDRFRCS